MDATVVSLLRVLPRTTERVFPNWNDRLMDPASKTKTLHRFCKRAGIERCGWHAFRRTFASRCAARGVPPPVIQKLLGHTSLEMTMRYIDIDTKTALSARDAIQRAMASPTRNVHLMSTNQVVHSVVGALPLGALTESGSTNAKADHMGRLQHWSG
ncbi:MAG: tyrosine-type recombinase/integrase [Patescibacteria group bacterium]